MKPTGATSTRSSTGAAGNGAAGSSYWRIYAAGAVVAAALSGGAYALGVQPLVTRHGEQRAQRAELQARRQKVTQLETGLQDWERRLTTAKLALDQTPLRLQPATLINQRLALVTRLAGESGLKIDEVLPGAPVDVGLYQTVPIVLVGTGPYPACAQFLHKVRERFPDTGVRSFESSNKNPAPEETSGNFRIELTWFTAPTLRK